MAKIYSLQTKKELGKQDTKANDKLAEEKGTYIGCLPKDDAEALRTYQEIIIVKQQKIDELLKDFHEDYTQYLANVADVLIYFKVDPKTYNPIDDTLLIGEDGHVWVVKGGNINND